MNHIGWTVATPVSGAIATFFLSLALLTFDVGVGYAIWTSVAGVGIVVLGALFFGQRLTCSKSLGIALVIGSVLLDQPLTAAQASWLAVIIGGVVWLKLADSARFQAGKGRPAA